MGLIYDAGESNTLRSALATNLAAATAVLDQTHAATDRLAAALGRGDLSGAGYQAVNSLFETIIAPTVANARSDIEGIQGELAKYSAEDSKVSHYGVLKEDELNRQLTATKKQRDATERQVETHRQAAAAAGVPGMAESLLSTNARLETVLVQLENDIRDLEEKLQALHGFADGTKGLFVGRLETLAAATDDTIALLKQLSQPFSGLTLLDTLGDAVGLMATRKQILEFLEGKKIAKDAKGRLKWGDKYLYNQETRNLYKAGKAFNETTGTRIDDYMRPFKSGGTSALKAPIDDFTGWKDASKLAKVGKGLGTAGAVLDVGANAGKYFSDGVQEHDWADFAVDSGVDLANMAATAAAGAVFGSFFFPPAGTVIGALVGAGAGLALELSGASDAAKDAIKKTYR